MGPQLFRPSLLGTPVHCCICSTFCRQAGPEVGAAPDALTRCYCCRMAPSRRPSLAPCPRRRCSRPSTNTSTRWPDKESCGFQALDGWVFHPVIMRQNHPIISEIKGGEQESQNLCSGHGRRGGLDSWRRFATLQSVIGCGGVALSGSRLQCALVCYAS